MTETTNPSSHEAGEAHTQSTTAETTTDDAGLKAELEKWRAMSRENEKRWKQSTKELEQLRAAQMTDQEKAIADARLEARQAALAEVGTSLVEAEIRAQAASHGVTAPTDYLDLTRFLGDDGRPDTELVLQFVSSLPKPASEPAFAPLNGAGHHSPSGAVTSMDPNELADLISGGKFI
ncbi:hypothetical protein FGW37_05350 [Streptomyces rectiverticillatus]|uniref:hypothetical protein n=1 Tax=Streptomyces rectiverticillatus TaxID=173860 RepID=UPI0015C39FA2|nr:hypothetical protein [Streptomyces rectiverticillatus]QLE71104.1 hypothetical protein FGW37_05350 [Streptomyces rectiverticillatus]